MAEKDVNAFLLGTEAVPSASFLTKGTIHEGKILDLRMRQQTDIKTRKPMFWDNGDPRMQLVVTLQTDEIDDEIEDDDGRRRLFLKYKLKDAVADAVRESGTEEGLEVGGYLKVKFVSQDKPEKRGNSGVKNYKARYTPPDPAAEANAFLDSDDPDEDEPPAPKAKKGKAKATRAPEPDDDADDADDEPPARRSRRPAAAKSARSKYVADDDDDGDEAF